MLTLYHAPQSRSSRIVWLLEELGAEYARKITNIPRADGKGAPDPANPHPDKKVPALVDDGVLITESIAIVQYLADKFPAADVGPRIGDPQRGPYLSWLAYYAKAELEAAGIAVEAYDHAVTQSIYFNDPDGNLIELYVDTSDAWKRDPAAVAHVSPLAL